MWYDPLIYCNDLPDTFLGNLTLTGLGIVYSILTAKGCHYMEKGASFLQNMNSIKSFVGPIIMPILGQLPDVVFIIYALTSSSQSSITIGMGCLVGSTVMLLSVSWGAVIFYGAVKLYRTTDENGSIRWEAEYDEASSPNKESSKLLPSIPTSEIESNNRILKNDSNFFRPGSGRNAGVEVEVQRVRYIIAWMVITLVPYAIISIGEWRATSDYSTGVSDDYAHLHKEEGVFEKISFFSCLILLSGYLCHSYYQSKNEVVNIDTVSDMEKSWLSNFDWSAPWSPTTISNAINCGRLSLGTVMVLLFSYPLIHVIDAVGTRTGMGDFYLAYFFVPLVTNGSVIMTAISFAKLKSRESSTSAFQMILGCVVVNNTMCLGTFMLVISISSTLVWNYADETAVVLGVQLLMLVIALQRVSTVFAGLAIMTLYPLSAFAIYVLESSLTLNMHNHITDDFDDYFPDVDQPTPTILS